MYDGGLDKSEHVPQGIFMHLPKGVATGTDINRSRTVTCLVHLPKGVAIGTNIHRSKAVNIMYDKLIYLVYSVFY